MDILSALSGTPLPTILVVGGMLFIALALGSQIGGRIEIPATRQRMAGAFGILLLLVGLGFYFVPEKAVTPTSGAASTGSNQTPALTETSPAAPTTTSNAQAAAAASSSCLESYFASMPADRVATLEAGVQGEHIVGPTQTKGDDFGILFTNNRQVVGGLTYQFFLENEFFKIVSVVDAGCNPVTDYENTIHGEDPNVLQNYDTLEMRLGGLLFSLRLGFFGGTIGADFVQVVE